MSQFALAPQFQLFSESALIRQTKRASLTRPQEAFRSSAESEYVLAQIWAFTNSLLLNAYEKEIMHYISSECTW